MTKSISLAILTFFSAATFHGFAQTKPAKDTVQNKKEEVMNQLIDYSRPGANHAILGKLAGNWAFQDKNLPFVKGTITRKPIYEGRFYVVEVTGGKLQIPIANGQMKLENYQEMEVEGYDNVKKAFISSSINNHIGSNIDIQVGSYDPSGSVFTYEWESELQPGFKIRKQRVLQIVDDSHYTETYYEEQNGTKKITRSLEYSRAAGN
ncbi:DUF1579 family protein [Dyadobacter luticola]|uniref:DUF1579 domain-containing protein n=1 Tax=Dyadobacter luticola TaxID=1979387 RepID=A0A5R9KMN4_9BACT|nr:DUF1579 family protein [Dyadobacter luticola]TLU97296.1 DUF1579 domain-containing protein [Dyadobacter luticola]